MSSSRLRAVLGAIFSSPATPLILPRFLTISSTNSSCSRDSRPSQPSVNSPSRLLWHSPQDSRTACSGRPQTGQVVSSGYIVILLLDIADCKHRITSLYAHLAHL